VLFTYAFIRAEALPYLKSFFYPVDLAYRITEAFRAYQRGKQEHIREVNRIV